MSFSRIRYNSGQEIFEVKIKDPTGATMDNWVFMRDDFPKWVNIMEKKYGLGVKKKKDKDLDWLQ